ncbi:MAG: YdcF family protein [Flavobacteriales bacterium]|nr:YdcF family protein [Flavobacteriales bacterium]
MLFWSHKRKRRTRFTIVVLALFTLLFCYRDVILPGVGTYLQIEESSTLTDAIVVLGGNSYDRGLKGAELMADGRAEKIICTGGNVPMVLKAIQDVPFKESEVTGALLERKGVSQEDIVQLKTSTSTFEEALEVLNYCKEEGLQSLTIVSSDFHLRRVQMIFEKVFSDSGIQLHYAAATSEDYSLPQWWKTEQGLILVFNEYVKLAYYWIKY